MSCRVEGLLDPGGGRGQVVPDEIAGVHVGGHVQDLELEGFAAVSGVRELVEAKAAELDMLVRGGFGRALAGLEGLLRATGAGLWSVQNAASGQELGTYRVEHLAAVRRGTERRVAGQETPTACRRAKAEK